MREKLRDMKQRSYDAEDKAMDRQIKLLKAQGKDTTDLERQRLKATIRYQANLQNETYALWVQNREKNRLILSELKKEIEISSLQLSKVAFTFGRYGIRLY